MNSDPFDRILGHSAAARGIRRFGRRAADVDAPVLLLGESGTGKGILARAVHEASPRARRAFVAVNCAAIPDTLFESEFFGHVRGAFTGAQYGHKGIFEQAHGGTLFLDEIGDMPMPAQAKLLTAIEDRVVRRVGAEKPTAVDVRIICATACDLHGAMAAARFRRDLFHRLSVLSFELPPLRERVEDIDVLVAHIVANASARYNRLPLSYAEDVVEKLGEHLWPGNIRELANAVERAILACNGNTLSARCISFISAHAPPPDSRLPHSRARYTFDGKPGEENDQIEAAMSICRGNKTRAAQLLGMSRNTLLNKLRISHRKEAS